MSIDQWYYLPGGQQVMFFKCCEIESTPYDDTYFSKYWITDNGSIKDIKTALPMFTQQNTNILIPVTLTEILDYYLDGELPGVWA